MIPILKGDDYGLTFQPKSPLLFELLFVISCAPELFLLPDSQPQDDLPISAHNGAHSIELP